MATEAAAPFRQTTTPQAPDLPSGQAPRNHAEVLARYGALHAEGLLRLAALERRQRLLLMLLAAAVVTVLALTAATLHGRVPVWSLLLSFAAVALLLVLLSQLQGSLSRARRLVDLYAASLRRAEGTEPFTRRTGTEAAAPFAPGHLYLHDLDIIGVHSLFSLLANVRTGIGERGLARFLLEPATHKEAVERQEAVRELLPQTELRERIALLGASEFQQLSASIFDDWLDQPPPVFAPFYRVALALTATVNVLLLLAGVLALRSWSELFPNLALALAVQAALSLAMRKRAGPLLESATHLQAQIRLFAEGLALLQETTFRSSRMHHLQELARQPAGAVTLLRQLDNYLLVVEQRKRGFFLIVSLLLAAGSQSAISITRWKHRNAEAMRVWLSAWAEFETLHAVAIYAFEHPADDLHYSWPHLLPADASPEFNACSLGHPLLRDSVPNDVALSAEGSLPRFLLISGSNMAGKSTLMRSMGVAAVLAYAGAPVRAASLRLTPLAVGASIALTDSLAEGKSKFLAEVERLAGIVGRSRTAPVLFLVDEIFSGTNSADRKAAAEAVLSRLLAGGAIGAFSTHDLALTTLTEGENRGLNQHMASPDPADPLAFDYLLRPGVNRSSNALAIIRMLGLNDGHNEHGGAQSERSNGEVDDLTFSG